MSWVDRPRPSLTPQEKVAFLKIAPYFKNLANSTTSGAQDVVRRAIFLANTDGTSAAIDFVNQSMAPGRGGFFSDIGSLLSSGMAPVFLGPLAGSLAGLANVTPGIAGATGGVAGAASGVGAGGQLLSSSAPIMTNPLTAAGLAAAPGEIGATGMLTQATQTLANAGITPQQVSANANNPSWLQAISNSTGLSPSMLGTVASAGLGMLGSYAQGQSATGAAQTTADAQIRAAQIAADAAKFRPVGVSSRFGQSQFGYDAAGNLTSAGYQLSPEAKAQQDALMGISNQDLVQYQGANAATAPMGQAAQSMMGLGQGYLQTSPQQQAQQYMAEQQALLSGSRASDISSLLNRQNNQGRGGLAMGGGGGMIPANPEMQAYYNALNQQNLQLAANAQQGGQANAQFGANMVGAGGNMLNNMYSTQSAAYNPYGTAIQGASGLENLGQQAMTIGSGLGSATTAAATNAGLLQRQGMLGAAQTMQDVNKVSPWGQILTSAGNQLGNYINRNNPPAGA